MDEWRKINIDQYDEDILLPSELYDADPRDPQTVLADAQAKSQAVRKELNKGDLAAALTLVLENAPYGDNVDEAKLLTLQAVLLVISSTKPADIPPIVKGLSSDQQDTLMKYLYKAMSMVTGGMGEGVNSGAILNWHEKLTELAGTGCIVRVMTDRRTV